MKEIKFSIIVPCYNVEQYIEKCVESVLAQTYPLWELILVDDASEDHTYEIIQRLSEKDQRVFAYTKGHGGLPQTRNYALNYVTGDYIALLDSDDFWTKDHLMKDSLIIEHTYPDMLIHNQHTYFTQKTKLPIICFSNTKQEMTEKERLECIFSLNHTLPASAVLTTYKVDYLKRYSLHYEESYRCSEDLDFFLKAISKEPKIAFAYHEFYFYRRDNATAMTHNLTSDMLKDRMSIYIKWFKYYDGKYLGEFDCSHIKDKLSKDISDQLLRYYSLKRKDVGKEDLGNYIKKNKDVFYYNNGRIVFFRRWLYHKKMMIKNLFSKTEMRF